MKRHLLTTLVLLFTAVASSWLRGVSLAIVAMLVSAAVLADDVSAEQALQIARQFAQSPQTQQLSRRLAPAKTIKPTMAHVMRSKESQRDNVYVINLGNDQGFVIVSAEDGADDVVLGYCDHGSFDYDECPIQLKDLDGAQQHRHRHRHHRLLHPSGQPDE